MREGFGSVEELASRCFEDFARSNDGQMKEVIRDLKERSEEIPERANMAATRAVSSPAELEERFKQQFQEVVNRIEDTEEKIQAEAKQDGWTEDQQRERSG